MQFRQHLWKAESVPLTRKSAPRRDVLPDAKRHSEGFRRTREVQRTALLEDYAELIGDLIDSGGEARQVDIASRLGVSQPTVAKMLRRMIADGLVVQKPYRGVFLSETGTRLASQSRDRHHTVESFLSALGVSADTARIDAEGIEHHVSAETLEAFRRFLRRSKTK